ncbi:hypothetical protein LC087_18580 [Bacillus carboniphilus]|uniref:Uncharacterized protein n=1 Tax=Bacillus carboniphilus TaxID=86663 RepID=A0ABY9JTI8_9BACI|nr:hypothetical protein [Bacillus carboniphilus]WLR42657.1 hypothetical protein LC087_18580 [Bacillus carboniphilus]
MNADQAFAFVVIWALVENYCPDKKKNEEKSPLIRNCARNYYH